MDTIIAIGADHRGYAFKELIKQQIQFKDQHVSWIDVGAYTSERSDYPIFAKKAAQAILAKKATYGVLLCGTGGGMAIAANRYVGIYAVVAWDMTIARLAKEDDHANVLVLPADYINADQAIECVQAWLEASGKPGRYAERIALIDKK